MLTHLDHPYIREWYNSEKFSGRTASQQLGENIYLPGDLDGDGIDEFIVQAGDVLSNTGAQGALYIVFGEDNSGDPKFTATMLGNAAFKGIDDISQVSRVNLIHANGHKIDIDANQLHFTSLASGFDNSVETISEKGAYQLITVDLNNDGLDDIVAVDMGSGNLSWYEAQYIDEHNPQTGIQYIEHSFIDIDGSSVNQYTAVNSVDYDNDGDLDLFATSLTTGNVIRLDNPLFNNTTTGDPTNMATWNSEIISAVGSVYPYATITGRFYSNEGSDIAASDFSTDTIKIAKHNGNGKYNPEDVSHIYQSSVFTMAAADLNNDGRDELVSGSIWNSQIILYLNQHSSTEPFSNEQSITLGGSTGAGSVIFADVDSDGDLDIAAANYSNKKIEWWENKNGDLLAIDNWTHHIAADIDTLGSTAAPLSIVSADVDNDGDIDFIVNTFVNNKVIWFENDGNQNFITQVLGEQTQSAGLTLIDEYQNGTVEIVTGGISNGIKILRPFDNADSADYQINFDLSQQLPGLLDDYTDDWTIQLYDDDNNELPAEFVSNTFTVEFDHNDPFAHAGLESFRLDLNGGTNLLRNFATGDFTGDGQIDFLIEYGDHIYVIFGASRSEWLNKDKMHLDELVEDGHALRLVT